MILYIIHMHNKSEAVMNINQVNLSKEKSIELENTNKTTFFNEKGEITIIKVNNKESDKTLAENFYKKPILLNDNHIVKISHYNKKDNLHSPKEDIPSKYNSKEDTEEFQYHKNGIPFANKEIVFNDFNGEEYNKIILNNGAIRKVYKNGTEIYKRKNIKKFYFKNKLHREYGPAIINYNEDGSVSYEEYYINGKNGNKEHLISKYYKNSILTKLCFEGREDNLVEIEFYIEDVNSHRSDISYILSSINKIHLYKDNIKYNYIKKETFQDDNNTRTIRIHYLGDYIDEYIEQKDILSQEEIEQLLEDFDE